MGEPRRVRDVVFTIAALVNFALFVVALPRAVEAGFLWETIAAALFALWFARASWHGHGMDDCTGHTDKPRRG